MASTPSPTPTAPSIPLTTSFTPAPSCLSQYYQYTTTSNFYWINLGPPSSSASACFPSGWDSTSQYFSPGLCPLGYTIACSTTSSLSPNPSLNPSQIEIETQATCCPSSYICQTNTQFNILPWESAVFAQQKCTLSAAVQTGTIVVTTIGEDGGVVGSGVTSFVGINAAGVSVRWRGGDAVRITGSNAGPTETAVMGTGTGTGSPPQESNVVGNELKTDVKTGIGVGAAFLAVVVLAVLAVLAVFVVRYRRRGRELRRLREGEVERSWMPCELNVGEVRHELDFAKRYSAGERVGIVELE